MPRVKTSLAALFLTAVAFYPLSGCDSGGPPEPENWFPLTVGTEWTYSYSDEEDELAETWTVTGTRMLAGKQFSEMIGVFHRNDPVESDTLYWYREGDKVYQWSDSADVVDDRILWADFSLSPGDSFTSGFEPDVFKVDVEFRSADQMIFYWIEPLAVSRGFTFSVRKGVGLERVGLVGQTGVQSNLLDVSYGK